MAETQEVGAMWNDKSSMVTLNGSAVSESAVSEQLVDCRFAHVASHGFFSDSNVESIFRVDLRKISAFEGATNLGLGQWSIASRNPLLLSGLVLSGANLDVRKDDLGIPIGQDGILTGEEIASLDLRNLDLVTLSACDTGLGDVAAGEGVFGLQRAFHQAGARSVIASLWKVDDNATKVLMVEFYKNLWQKKMSKAEALRQAQISMIKNYDPKSQKLRGLGDKSVKVDPKSKSLSPRFWAAFQLSGDWR